MRHEAGRRVLIRTPRRAMAVLAQLADCPILPARLFRFLVRKHCAEIEFIGNFLQSLVARPDGDTGL